jgi:hypothetical protein
LDVEGKKQMINDDKLPSSVIVRVQEFDRQQKEQYPLKVGSFRDKANKAIAQERLTKLGITKNSQYFVATAELSLFSIGGKSPNLLDPIEMNNQLIWMNEEVAKIYWNIAPGFFVIASDELGGFFLSSETGQIYDAAHYDAEKLGSPDIKPVFACFYDLLDWYLDPDFSDWEDYLVKKDRSLTR